MTELHYNLTEDDLLVQRLYVASKSPRFKKAFRKGRYMAPLIHLLIGCFLYFHDDRLAGLIWFSGVGLIWFLIFPWFYKRRYAAHYKLHIATQQRNIPDKWTTITFKESQLEVMDQTSDHQLEVTSFDELVELPEHYLLLLSTPGSIIVPKRALDNTSGFLDYFKKHHIPLRNHTSWAW
ncbi:MAG: hypothetical protein JJ975_02050 [Bacteroidia bacterium]|nr:hypothetical protein [Bacteroidia bacterium]